MKTRVPLHKCFSFRILLLAFVGTHLPLACLLVWYLTGPGEGTGPGTALLVGLGGTVLAAGVTMLLVHRMVQPILDSARIVAETKAGMDLPEMPTAKTVELGSLFKAVRRSFEKAKKLVDEKRDLISMLSHDLSSPATAVLGALHVLERDTNLDDESRKRLYRQLAIAAEHQIELVSSVMGLMKLDMDDEKGLEASHLPSLLDNTLERVRSISDAKEVRLEVQVPDIYLPLYPFLFKQAVENLLINAVKYSYPGQTVRLDVTVENGHAILKVTDQGIGFEPSEAEHLLKADLKRGKRGTAGEKTNGMGLYLVKRAAEHHRGKLHLRSAGKGKGAEFALCLPIAA